MSGSTTIIAVVAVAATSAACATGGSSPSTTGLLGGGVFGLAALTLFSERWRRRTRLSREPGPDCEASAGAPGPD